MISRIRVRLRPAAICKHVADSYERFPDRTEAMRLVWAMQTHHIDTEYDDRFFWSGRLESGARCL